jgi:hypothetical protein
MKKLINYTLLAASFSLMSFTTTSDPRSDDSIDNHFSNTTKQDQESLFRCKKCRPERERH